jgi:hypothetical protein
MAPINQRAIPITLIALTIALVVARIVLSLEWFR